MNTIIFEVTKSKTLVIVTNKLGNVEKIDITDTDIENGLIKLLKEIGEYKDTKQILDAINIDNWQSVKQSIEAQ